MSAIIEQVFNEVRGAWRFRWPALAAAWAVCIGEWVYVLSLPEVYRAQARVYVDTATAVRSLVQGLTVDTGIQSQLNFVRQAMLGRPALEKVARETDLDLRAHTPEAMQSIIDGLAARTKVDIQGGGRNATDSVYTIQYKDRSRAKSIQVVDTMLRNFVEDTLGGKRTGRQEAERFLVAQIRDYEKRLTEAETRLAAFKKNNVGMMPGEGGDYFARLQGEMDKNRVLREQLNVASSRREAVARQLRGEQVYIPSASTAPGTFGSETAGRIKAAQSQLDTMLLNYTEKHPDVIALRDTIRQLEERSVAELKALKSGDPAAALGGASANPVHQQLQLQLNQAEVEVATLQRQIADGEARVAEFRKLVDTVPEVEAEFARLNRDYDVTRAQYTSLVDRLDKARLSESADETGAVRFEVIDPANADAAPISPDRPRLLIMVLIAGLAIGGGVGYGLHMLKPVFNNVRTLSEVTGLPVLGAVSVTWEDRHRAEVRRSYIKYSAAAAALVVMGIMVLAFQHAGVNAMQTLLG